MSDKGFAGEDFEEFLAGPDLELTLVRPARKGEKAPVPFPNWLRQRVEAIIWTLKNQLSLERYGGRVPAGLWACVVQRLLASAWTCPSAISVPSHAVAPAAPDSRVRR